MNHPTPTPHPGIHIRPIRPDDDYAALTDLLHRAYAPLAAAGMRYLASHQDEATTRLRCGKGECFVAVDKSGALVGTIVLVPPYRIIKTACEYYQRPGVGWFEQFAVDPDHQGRGIAARLMDTIEDRAAELRGTELALDTSIKATRLIETYTRRGYAIVGEIEWSVTNYRSVIMSARLEKLISRRTAKAASEQIDDRSCTHLRPELP